MFEHFESDYASVMADRAHGLMREHGIACTPINFAIWFNYARNSSPELRRAIDALIADKSTFDWKTSGGLFLQHVAPTIPGVVGKDLPDHLGAATAHAKQYIAAAITENRDHIRNMGKVAEKVEQGADPALLVRSLIDELSNAATHAAELEKNLNDTSQELESIRESLKAAELRASTDTLTGLANRTAVEEFLSECGYSATTTGEPVSLLMLDVDNFRKINNEFGHGVGDQVLRLLANVLRDQLRQADLPGRFGGEELIAVLPGATLTVCEKIAERVRQSVEECRITRRSTGEMLPGVTVSIGIAQWRASEPVDRLIERCDKTLQLAKRVGRNKVVTERRLEG